MKYLKRVLAIVLAAVLLCTLFSGCGKRGGPVQIWAADRISDFADQGVFLRQTIDQNAEYEVTVFTNDPESSEANSQTLQSQLMAGEGPDVILFTKYEFGDVEKLLHSGNFLDLSTYFAESEKVSREDLVPGIMDFGCVGDACYLIPLGYSVISLTTTRGNMDAMGWEYPGDMHALLAQAADFAEDPRGYTAMLAPSAGPEYDYIFDLLLRASGIRLVDYETGTALPDEEELRVFLEAYRGLAETQWKQWQSGESYLTYYEYWGNLLNEETFASRLYFMSLQSPDAYMQLSGEQEAYYTVLGNMDGGVAGYPNAYVAVNANCADPDAAWEYVEMLLGETMQKYILDQYQTFLDTPVRKGVLNTWLAEYSAEYAGAAVEGADGMNHTYAPLGEDVREAYAARAESAVAVYNSDTVVWMLWESMVPYFEGSAEYETCIEELRGKLELYAKE